MSASFIALSDIHLGYDRCKVNTPEVQEYVATEIAKLTGGVCDKLILNGDCFEICIPADADFDKDYISPFVSKVSKSFFSCLTKYTKFKEIVFTDGNHDYTLWNNVFTRNKPYKATVVLKNGTFKQEKGVLDALLGDSEQYVQKISVVDPVYFMGNGWPYCAFTHGHLLDDLVLGHGSDVQYAELKAIGVARPNVIMDGTETLNEISNKTKKFVLKLWTPDSKIRQVFWALTRRDVEELHCNSAPGPVRDEPFHNNLGKNLKWFCDTIMTDPLSPFPDIRYQNWPSYLFVGHDHYGGTTEVESLDGFKFKVINTGGWTDDGGKGIIPHAHVIMWERGGNKPLTFSFKV